MGFPAQEGERALGVAREEPMSGVDGMVGGGCSLALRQGKPLQSRSRSYETRFGS